MQCASPLAAWTQMTHYLSADRVIELADSMMRRNTDLKLLTPDDFKEYLTRHTHFAGRSKCTAALKFIAPDTDSPPETHLRLFLQRLDVTPLLVNPIIKGKNKTWQVDLAHQASRTVYEYDGIFHNTDSDQWTRDPEKRQDLDDSGWHVFNVTAKMLNNPTKREELQTSIRRKVIERMSQPI
jgi:hypothetical protein